MILYPIFKFVKNKIQLVSQQSIFNALSNMSKPNKLNIIPLWGRMYLFLKGQSKQRPPYNIIIFILDTNFLFSKPWDRGKVAYILPFPDQLLNGILGWFGLVSHPPIRDITTIHDVNIEALINRRIAIQTLAEHTLSNPISHKQFVRQFYEDSSSRTVNYYRIIHQGKLCMGFANEGKCGTVDKISTKPGFCKEKLSFYL